MFDHTHYVPILKTKAGERWALENLEFRLRAKLTPVLEIHPPRKKKKKDKDGSSKKGREKPPKTIIEHIHEVCASIKNFRGSNPFFLDTEWVNSQLGTEAALRTALEACRSHGLKAIPVVKFAYDDAALNVIRAATEEDELGYMLRLDFEEASADAAICGVVDYLKLKRADVHLLLDYREFPMHLAEDVPKLLSLEEWKTFTAASAAFPMQISNLPRQTWFNVPRYDWTSWVESVTKNGLSRKPTFGDYATRCAGTPPGGGNALVHLRYTKDTNWIMYSNGYVKKAEAGNMRAICRDLITKPEYDGWDFSKGDTQIRRIALQDEGSGSTQQWVQWCANHHLTYVMKQIESRSDI